MRPRINVYRHRDGGFVCKVWGERWQLEFSFARRRRDRYGVGKPFTLSVTTWPKASPQS